MPQLDISTFFSQAFWLLVFFSLLFFAIRYIFLPKLDRVINIRSKKVLDSFNSSIHLLMLIEKQNAKYNEALSQAKVQAKKIIDDALIQVEEMKANVKDILEEKDKKINKLVEEKVTKFKSECDDKLKQVAIEITLIYYNKLTNSEIQEEFVTSLISKKF